MEKNDRLKVESILNSSFNEKDGHAKIYDTDASAKNNIYSNIYPSTAERALAWRIKYILFRWRGSVIKLIWHEVLMYMLAYYLIFFIYRVILIKYPTAKQNFELICVHCEHFDKPAPVAILTGFYVSNVVNRWWAQFMSIPWPDQLALKLVSFMPGHNLFAKNLRRTVIRYVNLSNILVLRKISSKVESRFPTRQSLADAKLLLPHEMSRLENVDRKTPHESTWVPLLWAMKLIARARKDCKVQIEAPIFSHMQSAFDNIERNNRKLLNYGWINFPLAYTQVATVITSIYFLAHLFSKQFLLPPEASPAFANATFPYSSEKPFDKLSPGMYFPFFTFVEFFCIMGWIKVAETLLNPFGDDDEDFDVNYIIDRNLQVSYLIVDEAEEDMEMAQDPFLEAGISIPHEMPHPNKKDIPSTKVTPANSARQTPVLIHKNYMTMESVNNSLLRDRRGSGVKEDLVVTITHGENDEDPMNSNANPSFIMEDDGCAE